MSISCGGCAFNKAPVCDVCKNMPVLSPTDLFEASLLPVYLIEGCLFPGEETFLASLAKSCTGEGFIVELGTYLGRSTASLGIGSRHGNQTKVYTFDMYQGDSAMNTHPVMFDQMLANMKSVGVDDLIVASVSSTDESAKDFNEPVELLFIDADHTQQAVSKDFNAWEPKVIPGGKIAFHDTYDIVQGGVRFVGPLQVIRDFCYDNERFKIVGRFQSITVVEKLSNPKPQEEETAAEVVQEKKKETKPKKVKQGVKK